MSEQPPEIRVLYRDVGFLVLEKPSGLATTSPKADEVTLTSLAHAIDPRAPLLHPSSRLDAEVSGVVVFARTGNATKHLLAARKAGSYTREYIGLAARAPVPAAGDWHGAIALDPRDPRKRTVATSGGGAANARESHTRYRTAVQLEAAVLLRMEPQTGRTHQLRVHAAHAGVPLLGDRHYGGVQRIVLADGRVLSVRRTMLHCLRVNVPAPDGKGTLRFEAEPPADMQTLWQALGGGAIDIGEASLT